MVRRNGYTGLLIGLAATAALAGVLLLFAELRLLSFVPLDIADAMIHLTPGAIATQGIETLGPVAKLLIELSGLGIFLTAGGLAGWLYGRLAPQRAGIAVPTLAGAMAALTAVVQLLSGGLRGGVIGLGLTILSYLVWGAALVALVNRAASLPASAPAPNRRTFLLRSGGVLLAVGFGSAALAQLRSRSQAGIPQVAGAGQSLPTRVPTNLPAQAAAPTTASTAAPSATSAPLATQVLTRVPVPTSTPDAAAGATGVPTRAPVDSTTNVSTQVPAPTEAPTDMPTPPLAPTEAAAPAPNDAAEFELAPGTRSPFNTNETLYVISSATRDPQVDRATWTLAVGGAVDAPFSLSYDELLALPRVDQTSTLECISNEVGNYLIGNCKWNGVRLRDLLERAGLQQGVIDIKLTAAEGYTESIPLAKALEPTSLIVYGIDGEALVVKHGFPARLIVPGLYGEKNVKWLTKIEAVREDYKGYWQQRGWTDDATIFTTAVSDIANPFLGAPQPLQRENGIVLLGGIAFAGNRGILRVEVAIDEGPWEDATLDPQADPLTWRFWRYDWIAAPGMHTVAIRATDGAGEVQTDIVHPPHPNGSTGYQILHVEVR